MLRRYHKIKEEPKKVSGSDDNKPRESKKRAATKRKSKG